MKKETIIYGGAFHPPTLAHQAIVQTCIDYALVHDADVWLLPSGSRKDKTIPASRAYRLALLAALTKDVATKGVRIRIETSELDRAVPTETYETVQELERRYVNRRFVWVFGTDSLLSMPLWRGGEELLRTLPMLIAEREGSVAESIGENCRYLGIKTGGISSTEVRRRLATGKDYSELVGVHVGALLRQYGQK